MNLTRARVLILDFDFEVLQRRTSQQLSQVVGEHAT